MSWEPTTLSRAFVLTGIRPQSPVAPLASHKSKADVYTAIGSRCPLVPKSTERKPICSAPQYTSLASLIVTREGCGRRTAQPQPCECDDCLGPCGRTRHPRQDSYTTGVGGCFLTILLGSPSNCRTNTLSKHAVFGRR
jgi:hypothetical protein